MTDSLTLPVAEAAKRVGVSESTLRRLIAAGRFPHLRVGWRTVVPVAQLDRWVDANTKAGT